jgi:hypothetical protein
MGAIALVLDLRWHSLFGLACKVSRRVKTHLYADLGQIAWLLVMCVELSEHSQ